MKFQYSFRHMRSSAALEKSFERKVGSQLKSLIQISSPVRVTFMIERGLYHINLELHARDGRLVEVREVSEDMQKTIDLVVETLYGILTRSKDKQIGRGLRPRKAPFAEAVRGADEGEDVAEEGADILQFDRQQSTVPQVLQH